MNWLLPQRVAAAADPSDVDGSVGTVLLLGRAAAQNYVARSPGGHWTAGRPLQRPTRPALWEIQSIVDLLRYENRMGRPVAVIAAPASLAPASAHCLLVAEGAAPRSLSPLAARYRDALRRYGEARLRWGRRHGDPRLRRVLVHTTSADALPRILRARALLSRTLLRARRLAHASASDALLQEPPDYADYICLGSPVMTAGEMVVNSHRLGHFYSESDDNYLPGVRMFFDRTRLASHPRVAFDGLHPLKIRDRLDLDDSLLAIAVPDPSLVSLCRPLCPALLVTDAETPADYLAATNDRAIAALPGLRTLQELPGHADIGTTARYLHSDVRTKSAAVEKPERMLGPAGDQAG